MTSMIHNTDRPDFALASDLAIAMDWPGIWLYPQQHSQRWDGRRIVEIALDGDWEQYEEQRFECGDGFWSCSPHCDHECDRILVECFVPAEDFPKLTVIQ